MKTRNLLVLLTIIFSVNHLFATDRVVQQGGPVGTYSSISTAISAAVDGDNIVINNRTDLLPWVESLAINKSLTFVSAVDNVQWWMEGTINVTMAEGRTITIVGLKNTSSTGHITKTGSTPTNRTVLNILSSDINGNITMGAGINFYLGSSKARSVNYTYGKILGNDLSNLYLNADGVTSEDVNLIIGNRIGYWVATAGASFSVGSNTQYVYASNNFVYGQGGYNACVVGTLKSGAITNRIINSTFSSAINGVTAMLVNHSAGQVSLENNIFCGAPSSSSYGIVISGSATALTTCTYNMYYNYLANGTVLSTSLNNFVSNYAYGSNIASDGSVIAGGDHVNAGSPANDCLDLDLTRNDVGVLGGSYSMANFLPLMNNPQSSRVNYMATPRIVNLGGTVNVQVIGFDK